MSGPEKLCEVKAEEELAPKKQKFYVLGSIAIFVAVAACTGIVQYCYQMLRYAEAAENSVLKTILTTS